MQLHHRIRNQTNNEHINSGVCGLTKAKDSSQEYQASQYCQYELRLR